jgi:hypothetical protein
MNSYRTTGRMKRYLPLNVPILRIVSMAEIGRSGKPEANVAWKFLKERKKISCLVVLFSIFVLTLFLPSFQYHKMLE